MQNESEIITISHNETPISPSNQIINHNNVYAHSATSENTRKAYRSDIQHFIIWGSVLPATTESIVQYLLQYAEHLNPRTLPRHLISLKQWHILQGFIDPTNNPIVHKTLKGIKRVHGTPKKKASGIFIKQLCTVSNYLTESG